MVACGTDPRPGKMRVTQGSGYTWLGDHHAQVLLAGNSPGWVSLRVMAWVVASDPPGCRGSGHPGALAIPADFIWARGTENLFHAVLCQSWEPESDQISPWERSPMCCPSTPINHQPTMPTGPTNLLHHHHRAQGQYLVERVADDLNVHLIEVLL